MPHLKFANIVFEPNERAAGSIGLYCRSEHPFIFDAPSASALLPVAGRYDFTTCFNALSIEKLRAHTTARSYTLRLRLRGAACTVTQTAAYRFSREPILVPDRARRLPADESWQDMELELQVDDTMVLAGFVIDARGPVVLASGSYEIETESPLRDVELAIAMTTFKKEHYSERNIELVRDRILMSDEELAAHLHMHVIDNGRTLDAAALTGAGVTVHPNDNVGGSGGFARGMIEAMRQQPSATHVILMDDDVSVSPESVLRTFNLLRIVRDEFADALISGAMFDYERGDVQLEDAGWVTPQGSPEAVKPALDMSQLSDCVLSEQFRIGTDQRATCYAGWWYCCVPVSAIERVGLPLPLFVRYDDIEYGIRIGAPVISMMGICIWHEPFKSKYSAAVERYQTTRNALIAQFATDMAPEADFLFRLKSNLYLDLKKYDYDDAELTLQGFEDFLAGPAALMHPKEARSRFMGANRHAEQLRPLVDLQVQAAAIDGLDLDALTRQDLSEDDRERRSIRQRAIDLITANHQRWPFTGGSAGFAVITAAGWVYPAAAIRNRRHIAAIDWRSGTGTIRTKDPSRFSALEARFRRDMRLYRHHARQLRDAYRSVARELTSVMFWERYLGLENDPSRGIPRAPIASDRPSRPCPK